MLASFLIQLNSCLILHNSITSICFQNEVYLQFSKSRVGRGGIQLCNWQKSVYFMLTNRHCCICRRGILALLTPNTSGYKMGNPSQQAVQLQLPLHGTTSSNYWQLLWAAVQPDSTWPRFRGWSHPAEAPPHSSPGAPLVTDEFCWVSRAHMIPSQIRNVTRIKSQEAFVPGITQFPCTCARYLPR